MSVISRRFFILGGLAVLGAGAGYAWDIWRRFGSLPSNTPESQNWVNGCFRNLPDPFIYDIPQTEPRNGGSGNWLTFFLERKGDRYPPGAVLSKKVDLHSLHDGEFVWLGHSSYLLKLAGKFICLDPVLASRASPVPFTIPAWPGSTPYSAADFPNIDYLCISHDHWDHLDFQAVTSLSYNHILCGQGVGAHFKRWGLISPTELDWWQQWEDGDLKFIFTPSKHFSGRGLTRNHSLWGGFVITAGSGGAVYFTGDGGYGNHFSAIGNRYGPFDIIFPDSGQYNRDWATVHMFPEQAVAAVRDTRSHWACPAHIGKFTLAWHAWDEPCRRFSAKAKESGIEYMLPIIGEKYGIDGHNA